VGSEFTGLAEAVTVIINTYNGLSSDDKETFKNDVDVLYVAQSGDYSLNDKILIVPAGEASIIIKSAAHTIDDHLGVDEICWSGKEDCGLEDYRTDEQKETFPRPIYRYGAKSNYTEEELRDTSDKIIAAFEQIITNAGDVEARDQILEKITKLYVAKAANTAVNGRYTWNGTDFGADSSITSARLRNYLMNTANVDNPLAPASIAGNIILNEKDNGDVIDNAMVAATQIP